MRTLFESPAQKMDRDVRERIYRPEAAITLTERGPGSAPDMDVVCFAITKFPSNLRYWRDDMWIEVTSGSWPLFKRECRDFHFLRHEAWPILRMSCDKGNLFPLRRNQLYAFENYARTFAKLLVDADIPLLHKATLDLKFEMKPAIIT